MSSSKDHNPKTTEKPNEKGPSDPGHEESIPAPSAPSDYSDAPLDDEQNSAQKRRHRRGGRREKSEKAESHIPWSERNGRLKPSYGHQMDQHDEDKENASLSGNDNVEEDNSDMERAERSSPDLRPKDEQTSSDGTARSSRTGVRAFNIKRAEASGGRPFGVTVEQPRSKGKPKKQKKAKKSRRSHDESEEEEEEEDEEEGPRKPLSIRLDLNLELEIFLKAKVKGDITITFLDSCESSHLHAHLTESLLTFNRNESQLV